MTFRISLTNQWFIECTVFVFISLWVGTRGAGEHQNHPHLHIKWILKKANVPKETNEWKRHAIFEFIFVYIIYMMFCIHTFSIVFLAMELQQKQPQQQLLLLLSLLLMLSPRAIFIIVCYFRKLVVWSAFLSIHHCMNTCCFACVLLLFMSINYWNEIAD